MPDNSQTLRPAMVIALGVLAFSPVAWHLASEGFSIFRLILVSAAAGVLFYGVSKALSAIKPNPLTLPGFRGSLVRCSIWGALFSIIFVFESFSLGLSFEVAAWGWAACLAGFLAGEFILRRRMASTSS